MGGRAEGERAAGDPPRGAPGPDRWRGVLRPQIAASRILARLNVPGPMLGMPFELKTCTERLLDREKPRFGGESDQPRPRRPPALDLPAWGSSRADRLACWRGPPASLSLSLSLSSLSLSLSLSFPLLFGPRSPSGDRPRILARAKSLACALSVYVYSLSQTVDRTLVLLWIARRKWGKSCGQLGSDICYVKLAGVEGSISRAVSVTKWRAVRQWFASDDGGLASCTLV